VTEYIRFDFASWVTARDVVLELPVENSKADGRRNAFLADKDRGKGGNPDGGTRPSAAPSSRDKEQQDEGQRHADPDVGPRREQ
jgi:hypothetical protein